MHTEIIAGVVVEITQAEYDARFPAIPLADRKAQMLADLAARRWRAETGGVTVAGMMIATDRESQTKVTAAYVQAKADANFLIPDWKFAAGVWGTLDAATIITVGDVVVAHVQACFSRERALETEILAAPDAAALAAIDIDSGWPA